jgi:uncharacterized membrane protein
LSEDGYVGVAKTWRIWRLLRTSLVIAVLTAGGAAGGAWLGLSVAMRDGGGGANIGAPVIYPLAAIGGAIIGVFIVLSAAAMAAALIGRDRSGGSRN